MDSILLKLPRQPRYMLALRLMAAGLGNLAEFSSEDIEDLKLAVSEACFSAPGGDDDIEVVFNLEEKCVSIEVRNLPRCDTSMLAMSHPSDEGISFLLMRNLMDSVEFRSDQGRTLIRMAKHARNSVPAGKA